MEDSGSSVTLVYYRLNQKWWNEPFLNIVAAAAQMSTLTHVEIAIGEEVGNNGMMSNVCRVFNDAVGVVSSRIFKRTPSNSARTHLVCSHRNLLSAPEETHSTSTRASAARKRRCKRC